MILKVNVIGGVLKSSFYKNVDKCCQLANLLLYFRH